MKPSWLVEDILCQGQFVCCAGEPGVGKSFLWYYMSLCIAVGIPFLGRPTTESKILYFDEENSPPDLKQYLRWAWKGLGQPSLDLVTSNLFIEHFELARNGTNRFKYMMQRAAEIKPALIVLDTATSACGIEDENDNAEASRVLAKLRLVQRAGSTNDVQTTVGILKHAKFTHDPSERRSIRGAKTWMGEVDSVIFHTASPGRPRKDGIRATTLEPEKVRAWGLKESLKIFPKWAEKDISLKLTISDT